MWYVNEYKKKSMFTQYKTIYTTNCTLYLVTAGRSPVNESWLICSSAGEVNESWKKNVTMMCYWWQNK
jgi:hypothetical protein